MHATPRELADQLTRRSGAGPVGVLLDYDGTLARIAPLPEHARPEPGMSDVLRALAAHRRVRVAVITGRSVAGLLAASGPLPGITLAANGGLHIVENGAEWIHPGVARSLPALRAVAARLEKAAARFPGARLEDKDFSLALHFRLAPEAAAPLLDEVEAAFADAGHGLRLVHGKMIYELQPDVPWDKGAAAREILDRWNIGAGSIFMGDDVIDEPAFVEMKRRGAVSVRVGAPDGESAAEWMLADVAEVQRTLEEIGARVA